MSVADVTIEQLSPTGSPSGKTLQPQYDLLGVNTSHEVNKIPRAEILLGESALKDKDFGLVSSGFFAIGTFIMIAARHSELEEEQELFRGLVIRQELNRTKRGPTLLVELVDPVHKMTLQPQLRVFKEKSDDKKAITEVLTQFIKTDAAPKVAKGTINLKGATYPNLVQQKTTDWGFILWRAEVNGAVVTIEKGKINVEAPKLTQAAEIKNEQTEVIDFSIATDANDHRQGVTYNFVPTEKAKGKPKKAAGTAPKLAASGMGAAAFSKKIGADKLEYPATMGENEAELKALASGWLVKSDLALKKGRIRLFGPGEKKVKPGTAIKLTDFDKTLDGLAFVGGLSHQVDKHGWTVDIQLGIDASWYRERPDAAIASAEGAMPPVHGLQLAEVEKLPAKQDDAHRIQVRLPLAEPPNDKIWARIATFHAGLDHTAWFLPEPGDMVVLGYIENDPREPIILGSTHRIKKENKLPYDAKKPDRGIVLKHGTGLQFDAKNEATELYMFMGKKKLKLVLDRKGKQILLDHSGKHSVTLTDKGIDFKTKGDLTIDAKNVTIKASGKVQIQGGSIDLK